VVGAVARRIVRLQPTEVVFGCSMPWLTLYSGDAVPAYPVVGVSGTWSQGQAIPNIASSRLKVTGPPLRLLGSGIIEVKTVIQTARTTLSVDTSSRIVDGWSVATVGHLMREDASSSSGCLPSHDDEISRQKSCKKMVLENEIVETRFQPCHRFDSVETKHNRHTGCSLIGVEEHREKRQQRTCLIVIDCRVIPEVKRRFKDFCSSGC
jgi:hypothetical protein